MSSQIFYQDLPINPSVDSTGDLSSVQNLNSVKQSIYMILNTPKGTRIFNPEYGSRLKTFLFEPYDETTAKRIGVDLSESLSNWEPRITIININVNMAGSNGYDVEVIYRIANTQQVDKVNVSLERL
jgi:phage baseplate assembly protein W